LEKGIKKVEENYCASPERDEKFKVLILMTIYKIFKKSFERIIGLYS
jgi:hypothetical protein